MSQYPTIEYQLKHLSDDKRKILDHIPHIGEIEGWILLEEAVELYDLCSGMRSDGPIVCEIGSWKGKSSYVLASAIKDRKGTLYCVDPFNGDGDAASVDTYKAEMKKMDVSLQVNFERTMNQYSLSDYIMILPFESRIARSKFSGSKIDLLFIDGNHEYDSVKNDFDLWSPLIPSGGYIVFHDVGAVHVDGPKRVFEEVISDKSKWKNPRVVGEMGIAEKV
ncbi:MAG: class I SAM-dependent methyltransferase [Patescibacteria group bacterium]|nr:class I SAM-dependent methyltransferase [Patescibacteria group bacterium]